MKKTYLSPELAEYGTIAALTGAIGASATADVLVDIRSGRTVTAGTGSFDECIKRNDQSFSECGDHSS